MVMTTNASTLPLVHLEGKLSSIEGVQFKGTWSFSSGLEEHLPFRWEIMSGSVREGRCQCIGHFETPMGSVKERTIKLVFSAIRGSNYKRVRIRGSGVNDVGFFLLRGEINMDTRRFRLVKTYNTPERRRKLDTEREKQLEIEQIRKRAARFRLQVANVNRSHGHPTDRLPKVSVENVLYWDVETETFAIQWKLDRNHSPIIGYKTFLEFYQHDELILESPHFVCDANSEEFSFSFDRESLPSGVYNVHFVVNSGECDCNRHVVVDTVDIPCLINVVNVSLLQHGKSSIISWQGTGSCCKYSVLCEKFDGSSWVVYSISEVDSSPVVAKDLPTEVSLRFTVTPLIDTDEGFIPLIEGARQCAVFNLSHEETIVCAICQEELDDASVNSELAIPSCCSHGFHHSCLNQWQTSQRSKNCDSTCPLCNASFNEILRACCIQEICK